MRTLHFQAHYTPFVADKNLFKKTINITFVYLLAPFILQDLKKHSWSGSRVYKNASFSGLKWPIFQKEDFFSQKTINTILMYLLAHFIVQNFKTINRANPETWRPHFGTQNGPIAPNENFFRKSINIILIYLLAPFTVQTLKEKKTFRADPELWQHVIFGPKLCKCPKEIVFCRKNH